MKNLFIKQLKINWDEIEAMSYLRNINTLENLTELEFDNNITFFVGENGSGKSTLLEGIAVAYGFNPEGGTQNYRFSTYEDTSELGEHIKLVKGFLKPQSSFFFRAETFFNVATKSIEYKSIYNGTKLHQQSHGESFLSFFQHFDEAGLFILDEPEAALSPQRQLVLLAQMRQMADSGAQFIIVTHSPILLGIPNAKILSFDNGEIKECHYEDTDSYKVTEMFVNNREAILRNLLGNKGL